jgi:diguanylate cyclase (GGDEF)-like protein
MSFRSRLTFFFVVIVIVPMIAVAVVLFRLISDNETGKADAGVRGRALTVLRLYQQDTTSPGAAAAATTIARDRVLGRSLSGHDVARAHRRAQQLLGAAHVARIALLRGGTVQFDVGDRSAIAPVVRDLVDQRGHPLGRLEVSLTPAGAFATQVRRDTGLQLVVLDGSRVLASTLPNVPIGSVPPAGAQHATQVTVGGIKYRVVTLPAAGVANARLRIPILADFSSTSTTVGDSRLLAAAFIVVFFIIAFAFAVLVSRSLQAQIDEFLNAARRLGSGDFSASVPISGRDEFAALGEEFNKMSRQLEERLAELREHQRRLEDALRRIGESFASNLDREAMLQIVLDTAVDGVGAAGGRAMVRSASGELEERARVGEVEAHQDALRAAEATVLESAEPGHTEVDGTSALGHPLLGGADGQSVVGLLSVARVGRAFEAGEIELFHYLAGQAGVSIENVDLHEQVQRQAVTDELTGLYNHRRFQEAITTEAERARRFEQSLGLVMLDIDNFKRVNDTYGHQQGDEVLREVAHIVREFSREIDAPARYGGEELAVVLPGTDLEGAYNLAERVRSGIEELRMPLVNGDGVLTVTASMGVAACAPGADVEPRSLIAAADAALYEAKRSGKNKTVRAQ